MTFASMNFAIFMVILFFVYYIVPKKASWMVLLLGNVVFYYFSGIKGLIFLLSVIILTYAIGLFISKTKNKGPLIITIFAVIIFVFLMSVMRVGLSSLIMPVGLSYYSLMCLGYIIDVYRKVIEPEKNILKLMTFISYFPHIIQGPFDDFSKLSEDMFKPHYFDYDKAANGIIRVAYGLMKKLVLADRIGNIVNLMYENPSDYTGFTVIMCVILYSFQLYADFSGYMDIAVGVSNMLGIDIKENFNVPFLAKSMAEFWRRWHMSLGEWFKNYVFYPVLRTDLCMGIRKKMKQKKNKYLMNVLPTVIGLFCVWTLIGLWHGFDWNYLIYDWSCGLIIIFSELMKPVYDKINKSNTKIFSSKVFDIFRVIRTFILVTVTFIIFRADTLNSSFTIIKNIFGPFNFYKGAEYVYWNAYDFFLIMPAFIILIVYDIMKYKGKDPIAMIRKINPIFRYLIYVIFILYVYVARHSGETVGFAYSIF